MKKHTLLLAFSLIFLAASAKTTSLPIPVTNTKIYADEGVKVRLILGGKTYDLLSYNLNYSAADRSKTDIPVNSSPLILNNTVNSINVTLRSTKIDQELMDWILSPDSNTKDGQIVITDADAGKTLKTINFSSLKPANYNENLYNNGGINTVIQPTTSFNMHFTKVTIKQ